MFKNKLLLISGALALCLASPLGLARGHSSGTHHHYSYGGGHYAGGHGSSHKGGHYVNPSTNNHYRHHR